MDLPLKGRRNTKTSRVKKHKKNLCKSMEERDVSINTREEFGHWEIDTVIGQNLELTALFLPLLNVKQGMLL